MRWVVLLFMLQGCWPLKQPVPVRARSAPTAPGGSLTASDILEVVVAHKTRLGWCVAEQRQYDPDVREKLLMVWDIEPSGAVRNVGVVDAQHADLPVTKCVAEVIASMRFKASERGASHIVFPMKF